LDITRLQPATIMLFRNIFFLGLIVLHLDGCKCSCKCYKIGGCATMTAVNSYTNSLVVKKSFCSKDNFYNDTTLTNSTSDFYMQYQSNDSITVNRIDSTFKTLPITVSSQVKDDYEHKNYECDCPHYPQ
jgi:hypothetical protein